MLLFVVIQHKCLQQHPHQYANSEHGIYCCIICTFRDFIRDFIRDTSLEDTKTVFVNWGGNPMNAGNVCNLLQHEFKFGSYER